MTTASEARELPDPAAEPTLVPNRAAAILGVSRTAVYDAIGRGEIPSLRVGRSIRIPTRRFLQVYFPEELATESDETSNPPTPEQGKQGDMSPNLTQQTTPQRVGLAAVRDSTAA
ncbi:helix-turn-helix domain-containing protein [Micromonospora sp. 4G57]|uniref:Helix-turn-helix domain-containing protein n=1 Tax=Micromonospora sicca TaxID=2202420 RepID=A0ABU5JAW7_9ACTN|nr:MULTISPECIES: helix-turn-helix domain-containing protein [unclassified Micromonospora]MDZ5443802.1 helix-turn-helix domain-containing protein [Micromonospora sp. 4G57]MDZ5489680.1 helix-turn-helix domain-containing protein [Micromonospora sp. 4G53]